MNGKYRTAVIDAAELLVKDVLDRHNITDVEDLTCPYMKALAIAVMNNIHKEYQDFIKYMEDKG
jgi:hypothetical protein